MKYKKKINLTSFFGEHVILIRSGTNNHVSQNILNITYPV